LFIFLLKINQNYVKGRKQYLFGFKDCFNQINNFFFF
jgi:hypothetical protein